MLLLEDIVLGITECCSGTEIIVHNGKQAFYSIAVRSTDLAKLEFCIIYKSEAFTTTICSIKYSNTYVKPGL